MEAYFRSKPGQALGFCSTQDKEETKANIRESRRVEEENKVEENIIKYRVKENLYVHRPIYNGNQPWLHC